MSAPYVVLTVDVKPGRRLPNGAPSGIGGETTYGVAITTNGIDRQEIPGVVFSRQREAQRYADALQQRLDEGAEA